MAQHHPSVASATSASGSAEEFCTSSSVHQERRSYEDIIPRASLSVEDLTASSTLPTMVQNNSGKKSGTSNLNNLGDKGEEGDFHAENHSNSQSITRNGTQANKNVDAIAMLLRRLDKLQSTVDSLQEENRQLSATFESCNGSAMINDLSYMSDHSGRRWSKYQDCLHEQYEHDFSHRFSLIFLHPGETRDYTAEEIHKIKYRPFPSRLFLTNVQLEGNTAWLRTRHTDHHKHKSSFIQVRDAIKADFITQNPPGAKYGLTELLNMCYSMNESNYYSFACTMASAFSCRASNTEFEKSLLLRKVREEVIARKEKETGLKHNVCMSQTQRQLELLQKEQERARSRLLQVMDIVFSKLKQKKLLVDESKANIYRLVLCMTKHSNNRWPFVYAIFSFFFQVCAATYVALSLTTLDTGSDGILAYWEPSMIGKNFALALGTACYGMMVAYPEMKSTGEVYRCLYRSDKSLLAFMDFVVNFLLPISGAICGFFVVLRSDSFLDGVLNAVALLFITEIDDTLPALLDLDTMDIVQGFLIDQAMSEYETQNLNTAIPPLEFSDMHITNTEESGSVPSRGVTFQPYEVFGESSRRSTNRGNIVTNISEAVRVRKGNMGQQVANKRSVTADCLLRKIEWQYTGGFEKSSSPRIGHLILHKLSDGSLVNIEGKQKAKPEMKKPWFSVTGVYVITSFGMSDDILRLRICGSTTTDNFVRAFQYYNLWPLSRSAKRLLKNKDICGLTLTSEEKEENDKVLFGSKQPEETGRAGEFPLRTNSADPTEAIQEEDGAP